MRLYLNASVYIGEDRYADCERVAQDILDGVYGAYEVADRWDALPLIGITISVMR